MAYGKPRRRWELTELAERRMVVMHLMLAGYTRDLIIEHCEERYGWTQIQIRTSYDAISSDWTKQSEEDLAHARAQAIQRIRNDLVQMREQLYAKPVLPRKKRGKKDEKTAPQDIKVTFKDLAAHEHLLARIEGTLRPIEVKIDIRATSRRALIDVINGMAPEELDALAIEQREIERKALGSK